MIYSIAFQFVKIYRLKILLVIMINDTTPHMGCHLHHGPALWSLLPDSVWLHHMRSSACMLFCCQCWLHYQQGTSLCRHLRQQQPCTGSLKQRLQHIESVDKQGAWQMISCRNHAGYKSFQQVFLGYMTQIKQGLSLRNPLQKWFRNDYVRMDGVTGWSMAMQNKNPEL